MALSFLKFFQPKDKIFHKLFEDSIIICAQISEIFVEAMSETGAKRFEILAKTSNLEHQADDIARQIFSELNKNFITPFDREDIYALASALDDVIDYEFGESNEYILKMAEYNNQSVKELKNAIYGLKSMKELEKVTDACIKVHGYESIVDTIYNQAMGDLIRNNKDNPIKVIVLKDLYEEMELISDKCQDASNVISSIVIKYS
jgi:uncharacterized protein